MARTKGSRTPPIEVKEAAIRMLESGMSLKEVGMILKKDPSTISRWHTAFLKEGRKGLERKPVSGRPRKLNDVELELLAKMLQRGAKAFGYKTDVWTLKRIAEVIYREFGVKYHPAHVSKLMKEIRFSKQKPEKQAIERNDEEIDLWTKRTWPYLRRKSKRQGKTLLLIDETGRAPIGQTPVLKHISSWSKCSIIGAVSPGGEYHYRVFPDSIRNPQVLEFLKHMLGVSDKNYLVLWDSAKIHKAAAVNEFFDTHTDRLETHFLPKYAPNRSANEPVWKVLKQIEIANSCPTDSADMLTETRMAMERIMRKKDVIMNAFHIAGLVTKACLPSFTD